LIWSCKPKQAELELIKKSSNWAEECILKDFKLKVEVLRDPQTQ